MNRIKSTGIFVLLGILIFSVAFSVTAQKKKLTYWHTHSPEEAKALKELVSQFERAHPDIEIKTQQVPHDEMHRKLIVSLSGGMAPDLARLDIVWVPEFAHMGALVPLDKKFSKEFKGYPEKFFNGPISTCYWKGNYYGLPVSTNTRVFFWNKDMFKEAGISQPPETYEEMLEVARELTKDVDGDGELEQWGIAIGGTYPWAILPFYWSAGGQITNEEITKATGYLNSEQSVEALRTIVDLYKDGAFAPTITGGGIGTYEGYAKNKYAMFLSGPWAFPIIGGQFPDKELSTAIFPEGPGGSRSVIGGEDTVIFKQSDHPKAAWEFVKFLVDKESRLKMAKQGVLPVLKSLSEEEFVKEHDYFPIYLKQMETAKARLPHPEWEEVKDIFSNAVEQAIRGKKTPKEALDEAAKKIDPLLK